MTIGRHCSPPLWAAQQCWLRIECEFREAAW